MLSLGGTAFRERGQACPQCPLPSATSVSSSESSSGLEPALWFLPVTCPCVDRVLSGLWASSRGAVSRQGPRLVPLAPAAHAALDLSLRAPSLSQDPGRPELALTQPGAAGGGLGTSEAHVDTIPPHAPAQDAAGPGPQREVEGCPCQEPGAELRPLLLHSAAPHPQVPVPAPGGLGGVPGWGPHPHGPAR